MGKIYQYSQHYWKAHLLIQYLFVLMRQSHVLQVQLDFSGLICWIKHLIKFYQNHLVAENKINILIDEIKEKYNLKANDITLSGFSQGCMLSLQTGIKT